MYNVDQMVKNGNSIRTNTIRGHFRKCVTLDFLILQDKHSIHTLSKNILFALVAKQGRKAHKGLLLYLFLKLIQIKFTFSQQCMHHIYLYILTLMVVVLKIQYFVTMHSNKTKCYTNNLL